MDTSERVEGVTCTCSFTAASGQHMVDPGQLSYRNYAKSNSAYCQYDTGIFLTSKNANLKNAGSTQQYS